MLTDTLTHRTQTEKTNTRNRTHRPIIQTDKPTKQIDRTDRHRPNRQTNKPRKKTGQNKHAEQEDAEHTTSTQTIAGGRSRGLRQTERRKHTATRESANAEARHHTGVVGGYMEE